MASLRITFPKIPPPYRDAVITSLASHCHLLPGLHPGAGSRQASVYCMSFLQESCLHAVFLHIKFSSTLKLTIHGLKFVQFIRNTDTYVTPLHNLYEYLLSVWLQPSTVLVYLPIPDRKPTQFCVVLHVFPVCRTTGHLAKSSYYRRCATL